ncbi:uncharacterized protein LACBIDRAFT_301910 [Laccaria bicolor S238N-H82]|uniref:Predicted protein n=1 Tax=Laccaria bicolor (strain S238N-H82 / ATCC MYA-4686) TaxID=486041 RepID=B0CPW5_LACBS|nr:uncharacterized protein LACBIDRAFT_301910 [Laccaria bicolor S238N-H82]EDR16136.1 predicted protein [Laccaria bicolor S238N-H82]|eukprot:XP_001874344.1 predicted protein [Laccaria bicolor S238N-H82]
MNGHRSISQWKGRRRQDCRNDLEGWVAIRRCVDQLPIQTSGLKLASSDTQRCNRLTKLSGVAGAESVGCRRAFLDES